MQQGPSRAIPIAIVIAGVIVAGSVYMLGKERSAEVRTPNSDVAQITNVRAISSDDHVLGNPAAPIVIVGYSDTECPYCKQYHSTLHRIIETYGPTGQVSWVYRHFPIAQLHPRAVKEAEALECATAQGGTATFWKYADAVYEAATSNNTLDIGAYNDPTKPPTSAHAGALSTIAKGLGLDVSVFEKCLSSGTYTARISRDVAEATAVGGTGTPMSIILVGGEQIPVPGAQTYDTLKGLLDTIIATSATQ